MEQIEEVGVEEGTRQNEIDSINLNIDKINIKNESQPEEGDASTGNFTPYDLFYILEGKIKDMLSFNVEKQFKIIYEKFSDKEKSFFDEKNFNFKIGWVFNINSKVTNRGDLSTSTLQKFFHSIFKDFSFEDNVNSGINLGVNNESNSNTDNNISNNNNPTQNPTREDFLKFKNTFMELFQVNLLLSLNGENLVIDHYNLNNFIAKIEIKNGFLNVYLKGKGKILIEEVKNSKVKEKNKIKEVDSDDQFIFNSIGHIESCFPEKFSVPRQGNLLQLTRAKIIVNSTVDMSSFEGIENFEYVWIIYVFHLNKHFGKAKISPPKYDGRKLGIFATRTPHRYNPIGLTLAKFEKIEKNEIFISSVDMISGTPVLDIKPYHHLESLDINQIRYPDWIKLQASDEKRASVIFTETAEAILKSILLHHKLVFYDNYEDLYNLIKGILEIDPHSKHTQKKKDTTFYAFYIDKLNVIYEYNSVNKEVIIQSIEYSEEYKKLRNKTWLENYAKNFKDL